MRADQITDPVCFHGEGLVWWERWGKLRFVDMFAGDVMTLDGDRVTRTAVGSPVAAVIRPRMGGGAIVARERDVAISNFDDLSDLAGLVTISTDPGVRCNDGGCDPDGGFWIGTLAYGFAEGAGTLYNLEAGSLRARPVLDGLSISNGIDFSPDTSTMYLNDSGPRTTWAFDYDPVDGLRNRRVFATGNGIPDGLCVDSDGGIWTARYGEGTVLRHTPDGTLDAVVEVGPSRVTDCCFGGADLDTLFITTSRENLPADAEPEAGSVFAIKPGVTGRPAFTFAG